RLLASPLHQVIFVKTTTADVASWLGVLTEAAVTVAPCALPTAGLVAQSRLRPPIDREAKAWAEAFEPLLCKLLYSHLNALGAFAGTAVDIQEWQRRFKLPGLYQRWMTQSLRVLESYGYLTRFGETLTVSVPPEEMGALWQEWEAHKAQAMSDPDRCAYVTLVDITLRALPAILRGEQSATAIMFPNSSLALVEGIYKRTRLSDYFNEVLSEGLIAYVKGRLGQEPGTKLRMLEIGAGTGGTSSLMFECLASYSQHIEEYCYTDISRAFLLHAQEHYGSQVPYLTTRLFNVEQGPVKQGIEVGTFDVVIAANVLHATRDMRNTLRNTKALLKRRGLLLINEMTAGSLFSHLTFGLLEGWWLYEDGRLRIPGSPALAPETWRTLLNDEGFLHVGYPAEAAHEFGQQIIVAQSDGVVRQNQATASPPAVQAKSASVQAAPLTEADDDRTLRTKLENALARFVSEIVKIKREEIDVDVKLTEFGFDSIMVSGFANVLNER
ncbi:methyltransferase, partial [Bradyrhizobium sp. SZCCHNS1012]